MHIKIKKYVDMININYIYINKLHKNTISTLSINVDDKKVITLIKLFESLQKYLIGKDYDCIKEIDFFKKYIEYIFKFIFYFEIINNFTVYKTHDNIIYKNDAIILKKSLIDYLNKIKLLHFLKFIDVFSNLIKSILLS
jgi:hypothetical protein